MGRSKNGERVIFKNYSCEISHIDIMFRLVKLYLEDKNFGICNESDMLPSE